MEVEAKLKSSVEHFSSYCFLIHNLPTYTPVSLLMNDLKRIAADTAEVPAEDVSDGA